MPSALSLDLRRRIASVTAGETVRSVAARFGVSAATAVRFGQKGRSGEDLSARPRGAPPEMIIKGRVADWVKSRIREKPDLTVRALAAELCDRGTIVTHDTVWRFIRREGLSFKKLWWRASGTGRRWLVFGIDGKLINIGFRLTVSSSWMRLGSKPT